MFKNVEIIDNPEKRDEIENVSNQVVKKATVKDNDILENMEDVIEMLTSKLADKGSYSNVIEEISDENVVEHNSRTCEMDIISVSNVLMKNKYNLR